MGKEALVVERKILFGENEFQGFLPLEERDFLSVILDKKNYFYYSKGEELEKNHLLKQIIPYLWIVNPDTKKIFLYKRILSNNGKKEGEYKERRYIGDYSGGVGGHIDRDTESDAKDPIMQAMMRELKEEVVMKNYPKPRLLGYVNDDSNSLGSVHFGIVAIAETREEIIARRSEGLSSGCLYSIIDVDRIFNEKTNNVESWTKISWPYVKDYLQKL